MLDAAVDRAPPRAMNHERWTGNWELFQIENRSCLTFDWKLTLCIGTHPAVKVEERESGRDGEREKEKERETRRRLNWLVGARPNNRATSRPVPHNCPR